MSRASLVAPPERCLFTATLKLAEVDTTRGYTQMVGRAAPYGQWTNRGWFLEQFAAGLFEKSIKEAAAALPLLLWHDGLFWPIGSAASAGGWESKPDGLWGTWDLDGSADAQRAAQMAKDGHLPYLSVGYQPIRSSWQMSAEGEWDPDDAETLDRVTREEARLVETSVCSTPAFADAAITLVRTEVAQRRPRRGAQRPHLTQWQQWRSSMNG